MFKKHFNVTFVFTMALLSWSFADNRDGYNYPARNVDTDNDMSRSSRQKADYMMMQDQPITPDAGPRVARGADVFATADFIYWSVREDGLAYAQTGTTEGLGFVALNATKGSARHPNFKWEPGFKVGLGLNLSHDGWDLFAQYTWLRSHPGTRKIVSDPINPVNATKLANWEVVTLEPSGDLIFASGRWKFNFNVIDLELGRNFYVSKFLTSRPHIGLKGTWQDDDYKTVYVRAIRRITMKNNIDFWGLGVRTGMDNAWYFMRNFCLFGDFAISALWSDFKVRRKDLINPDIAVNPPVSWLNLNLKDHFKSLKAVLELAIGLRYDVWWSDDDYHFDIQAGWEQQLWFDHNQHYKQLEECAHGDLALQGLTLKVRLDF